MEIVTAKNQTILVSAEDYEHLNQFKWSIDKLGYVHSTIDSKSWTMHRYIMINILGYDIDSKTPIDHINNTPSDNRIENLRIVTYSENSRNREKKKLYKQIHRSYKVKDGKWRATINLNNKRYVARYEYETHAAYQYNLWIDELQIKNANKNILEIPVDFVKHQKKKYKPQKPKNKYVEKQFNTHNQCIIKIVNTEIIIDEELHDDITKHCWYMRGKYARAKIDGNSIGLSNYIMKY